MNDRDKQLVAFSKLLDVIDELREKCPWDKVQTNESLRTNTIEEAFELCDALMNNDKKNIKKELGDVLMHVCFYAKIGSETNDFDIEDVCNEQVNKLIYRHPHIYGNIEAKNKDEVLQRWEQLKLKEKDGNKSVLSGIPSSLPSLVKAYRIQEKAQNVGFDWKNKCDMWEKVKEELDELKTELNNNDKEKAEKEFGDYLFSLINAARFYGINPDNALEKTNIKFTKRFNYIEENTIKQGKSLKEMSLEDMDKLWNEAKLNEL